MLKRAAFVLLALAVLSLGLLPSGATAQTPPPETSSLLVKLVSGLSVEEQAAIVARNGGTETSAIGALRLHVVQVLTVELAETIARYEADPQVQHVEENRVRRSEMLSNDEHAVSQWALPQIGWDLVFGPVVPTGTAKVAILDSGIDANHPDLAGRVVPGTSILDGSNGMSDSNGHGTWVAGIIAANTDNTIGIAGVAFAGVQMVPVTVLDANGEGRDSDVIAGVIWAADHGADVILMAFSNPGFSPNLQDAIDYAWSRGAVLVAAAGNDGVGTPTFPAGDRGVIGVSGTDQADALLGYSNYGKAAFLAAPGESIATTDLNGDYVAVSGTSSSAAIVAGVAAFLKAVDPALTNGIIVGRMARTADPAGTQEQTGNGRVNLARALTDTGTDEIQPAGAAPVGDGGPFVGPYVAAACTVTGVTVVSQSPTGATAVPGDSITYTNIPVAKTSNGNCTIPLTITWIGGPAPAGTVATFSPSPITGAGNPKLTTLTITTLAGTTPAGTRNFTVTAGDSLSDTNGSVTSSNFTFQLNKLTQTITVTAEPPASAAYGDTFGVAATASSSLTVSIGTSTPSVCTASGSNITMVAGSGTCTITFNQAGDATYSAAPQVTRDVTATKRSVTVTPDAGQFKVYGTVTDPTLTYGYTPALATGDSFSGALSRVSGENAGLYNITQGTLALSNNYTLVFMAGVTFEIKKLTVTVTPNAGQFKVYGTVTDPTLTYGYTPALTTGDSFSGALSRVSGENVGLYNITQGTLALSNNYTLVFMAGVTFEIKKLTVTVTPNAGQFKVYGTVTDPTLTYGYTPALATGDSFSGALSRVSGENVGLYNITQGTLALSNNYTLVFMAGVTFEIKKLTVTVTPDAGQFKNFGTPADPTLTYGYTPALATGDSFSGALSRVSGENAGLYNITQGTLALSNNYTLVFMAGVTFEIKKLTVTVTPDAGQFKNFGTPADPTLTYGYTPALATGDSFSGALSRVSGENAGLYNITQGTLALSNNYTLVFMAGVTFEIKSWWTILGFYQPVDMGTPAMPVVWNTVKGGSTVPLKFEIFAGFVEQTTTAAVQNQTLIAAQVACATGSEDAIEEIVATGGTVLRYDGPEGKFIYNWKTPKSAGTCYRITMTAADGSSIWGLFKLK